MLIGSTFVDFTAGSKIFERSHISVEPKQSLVLLQQHRITVTNIRITPTIRSSRYDLKFVREWTQVACKSYPILYEDKLASILALTGGVGTKDRLYRCID